MLGDSKYPATLFAAVAAALLGSIQFGDHCLRTFGKKIIQGCKTQMDAPLECFSSIMSHRLRL